MHENTDLLWGELGLLGGCRRGRNSDSSGGGWCSRRSWRVCDLRRKPTTLVRGVHIDLYKAGYPKHKYLMFVLERRGCKHQKTMVWWGPKGWVVDN